MNNRIALVILKKAKHLSQLKNHNLNETHYKRNNVSLHRNVSNDNHCTYSRKRIRGITTKTNNIMLHEITVNGITTKVEFKTEPLREIHIKDAEGHEYAYVNEFTDCTIMENNLEFQDIGVIYEIAGNFEKYFSKHLNEDKKFIRINVFKNTLVHVDYNYILTKYLEKHIREIEKLKVNEAYYLKDQKVVYILRIK